MNNPYQAYTTAGFNTTDPMKLILMLYDGAINFLKDAVECTEKGDIKGKNIAANSARDIIVHLNASLNIDVGGDMAKSLRGIYLFMNRHLLESNWKNDIEGFKKIIELLEGLRSAWQDAYNTIKSSNAAGSIQAGIAV